MPFLYCFSCPKYTSTYLAKWVATFNFTGGGLVKQTEKLEMNLPEYTDAVDIEQLNDNFKILDKAVDEIANKKDSEAIVWDYF